MTQGKNSETLMEQLQFCEYLYIRHSMDSVARTKTSAKDQPKMASKKWKRRWVVLSGNISPSRCYLNYCKKESDWLSNNQREITQCQLANFSVQKLTGNGKHDNHLVIYLGAYAICLSFESITKMDQWYTTLLHLLEFHDVTLQCPEHPDLNGEYVAQFSSPGPFKMWGMDRQLRWEWPLSTVRRISYQKRTEQLEIEVGRKSYFGEGHFFFSGERGHMLYYAIRDALHTIAHQTEQSPVQSLSSNIQAVKTHSKHHYSSDSDTEVVQIALTNCPSYIKSASPNTQDDSTSSSSDYASVLCQDFAETNLNGLQMRDNATRTCINVDDDNASSKYASLEHQESVQATIYDDLLTIPKPNSSGNQSIKHKGSNPLPYTPMVHQNATQTGNTLNVQLACSTPNSDSAQTTSSVSPLRHDSPAVYGDTAPCFDATYYI